MLETDDAVTRESEFDKARVGCNTVVGGEVGDHLDGEMGHLLLLDHGDLREESAHARLST